MKRNAVVRIVLYSLVIVILLGLLATGLGLGMFSFKLGDSGTYTTGGSSVTAEEVRNIEIEWASGTITILPGDVEEITFTESGASEGREMVYGVKNGTLSIHYTKPGVRIGFVSMPSKDLTITVPQTWSCGNLAIEAASTDVEIQDLTLDLVEMESASGNCTLSRCQVRQMDLDGASCDFTFTGTLEILDCEGASLDMRATFYNTPEAIEMEGASAKLDITLPLDSGFRAEMDGMSSTFSSDFETISKDGCYIFGDGRCQIQVEGVSANVRIQKGTHEEGAPF